MKAAYRLTVLQSGNVARFPVEVNEATLEEALLMASFFDSTKVATILDCAKRIGIAEYTEGADRPVYVVELLDAADAFPAPPVPKFQPDKLIWPVDRLAGAYRKYFPAGSSSSTASG